MKIAILVLTALTLAGCKKSVADYKIEDNLPVYVHPAPSTASDPKNAFLITPEQRRTCRLLKDGGLIVTCNEKVKQCKAKTHTSSLIDVCMRKELGDASWKTLQKAYRQERGESWKKEAGVFGF